MLPNLKTCPPFGPNSTEHEIEPLPEDFQQNPLKYLPPRVELSKAELDLARRYENRDFSGGYLASQIAHIRSDAPAEKHDERRKELRAIQAEVERQGLTLPPTFVTLFSSDEAMNRLHHGSIWLYVPVQLVPLPANPHCQLLLMAWADQGLGYWYLLLAPEGSHSVAFCKQAFGSKHFNFNRRLDPADYRFWQCSGSFDEWIVRYFQSCLRCEQRYAELLKQCI